MDGYYPPHQQPYPYQMPPVDERRRVPLPSPITRRVTMPVPQRHYYQHDGYLEQHEYAQLASPTPPDFPQPHHYGAHAYLTTAPQGASALPHDPVTAVSSFPSPTRSHTMSLARSSTMNQAPQRTPGYGMPHPQLNQRTQTVLAPPSNWEPYSDAQVRIQGSENSSNYSRPGNHRDIYPPHDMERSIGQPSWIGSSTNFPYRDSHIPHSSSSSNRHWGIGQGTHPDDLFSEPEHVPGFRRKALLIGIDYKSTKFPLDGCINDVERMGPFLNEEGGYPVESIITLTENSQDKDKLPTKKNILSWIRRLVDDAREGDRLFFHFSGHGFQVPDEDGDEGDDHMDEALIPLDFDFKRKEGGIIDDELNDILVRPLPKGCRLTAIIDACHSGSALDLQYMYRGYGEQNDLQLLPGERRQDRSSRGDVVLFSGCQDDQKSRDREWGGTYVGTMTDAFLHSMSTNKGGQSYRKLMTYIRNRVEGRGFSQIPQMSSSQPVNVDDLFIF